MKEINSYSLLIKSLKAHKKSYLLLYKSGLEQSDCALTNLTQTAENAEINILTADVKTVRDIHQEYNISTVPVLLEFEGEKLIKSLKGCHQPNFYKSVFENSVFVSAPKDGSETQPQKRVTVYSTPTCSWCTRLKNYLKHNNIKFRDVDVSKDQKSAEAMVKKSGKQGVPQIDINGRIIVGFDKPKINKLLGI